MTFNKADNGKAPLHHLGDYRKALEQMARIADFGANKYGRMNWKTCDNIDRYKAAAMRHLLAALSGEGVDADHGQTHWAAVMWNCAAIIELEGK
jgi:hypothetical protein